MSDAVMNNKRRLERHRRKDGNLQSRARPAMLEREVEEDASSVAFIRNFVEQAHQGVPELGKRLIPLSGTDDGESGDGTSSSKSTGSTRESGDGTSSSSSSSGGRPGGFEFSSSTRDASTRTSSSDGLLSGLFSTSSSIRSSTSSTPESTRTSSSTSSTPTSTRSSSSSSSAILTTSVSASSSSTPPTTSFAYVTSTPTPTVNSNAAASQTADPESSGPGAGPIIGIVAGSLAGIAIIAAIIGFLIKKFGRKEDPYEADPFDRDDFRRQSAMLPETFESEDGHPSMSEHHNLHNSTGPFSDPGYPVAGAVGAGGMAAANSFTSHNESGGPRPPTMFQRHINGPGAQYSVSDAPPPPQVGAIFNHNDMMPQLPPMAFGGSDPYSIAGVGRSNMEGNMNNPYAHLDRSMSNSQSGQNPGRQDQYEEQDRYADLDRNGSHASYPQQGHQEQQNRSGNDYESSAHGYNTAGRPGTAEGRSGTPDLPNVQQTYALGDGGEPDRPHHQEMERVTSPHHMMASPQHMSQDMYSQYGQSPFNEGGSPPLQPLQVRNLLPNPHAAQHAQQAQRPISSASSQPGDDEAAYGGVW